MNWTIVRLQEKERERREKERKIHRRPARYRRPFCSTSILSSSSLSLFGIYEASKAKERERNVSGMCQ